MSYAHFVSGNSFCTPDYVTRAAIVHTIEFRQFRDNQQSNHMIKLSMIHICALLNCVLQFYRVATIKTQRLFRALLPEGQEICMFRVSKAECLLVIIGLAKEPAENYAERRYLGTARLSV